MYFLCVRGDTKSLIHFIESFIKLPSKGVMTRSVLEHDDEQRKSAADQMVRSENKIFCRKENQAILGAVGYRALYTFPNRYKRKRREESQVEKPVIPNLIFIHSDYNTCLSLVNEYKLSMNYLLNLETRQLLVVPDKQMQDFMFLLDFSEDAVQVLNENLRQGDRVRVIKGEFAGIEGELIRIKGHKRVVVRLEGAFSLATTYIPGSYLERI